MKVISRKKVFLALRKGDIKKQPCEVCGKIKKVEAHHDNYLKPLDVRWLCKKHHTLVDTNFIKMKDTNIRVLQKHHKLLVKLAKKEGRTIKATFGFIIDNVWKNSSSI